MAPPIAPTPSEVFRRLVDGVADKRYDGLAELYAERTDVRHPMWPGGTPPLTSRDDLRRHFAAAAEAAAGVHVRAEVAAIHETQDPEVIVAEFEYRGSDAATGEPFAVPCIFVMRVRDGRIVESRDYIDHLASARVRGRLDDVLAAVRPSGTA